MSKQQLKKQDSLYRAYQKVFNSPDGKKVLEDLCVHCNILQSTYAKDPYETYFKEGKRAIGMHILMMLSIDLVQFQQIIKSHSEGVNDDEI